jgi:hypothetical protein
MAHGRTELIDEAGQPLAGNPRFAEQVALHRQIYDRLDALPAIVPGAKALRLLLQHNFIGATSLMIRTTASRRIMNYLHFDWVYATDWSHWLLHLAAGGDLAYDNRPLTRYRVHSNSLSYHPQKAAMRDAETRLVPLWALSVAASLSIEAGTLWMRWRKPLYALWLLRALKLRRQGLLADAWLQMGAIAFYGRGRNHVRLWTELARHAASVMIYSRRESAARRNQFFVVSGLAQVNHPFYRNNHENHDGAGRPADTSNKNKTS